jgi:hypothetical protein
MLRQHDNARLWRPSTDLLEDMREELKQKDMQLRDMKAASTDLLEDMQKKLK